MKLPDLRPYGAAITEHPVSRQMTDWFRARSEREQMLLIGMAGLSAAVVIYATIWLPLEVNRRKNLADLTRSEILLAQVRAAGDSLNSASARPRSTLSQSAATFGLTISALEPAGDSTKVVLEAVEFNELIRWLADIQMTNSARLTSVEISRKPEPGVVSATLIVEDSQ